MSDNIENAVVEEKTAEVATSAANDDTKAKSNKATKGKAAKTDEAETPEVRTEPVKVKIKLPRLEGENVEQTLHASVNFKPYLIPRGVWISVPVEVAEVIENMEKEMEKADAYSEEKKYKEPQ